MYKWKISEYRKDKRTGVISPVKPSEYYQSLSEGMGWNERKADRERITRLQLDDKRDQKAASVNGI